MTENYKYSITNLDDLLKEKNPNKPYTVNVRNDTLGSEVEFNKFNLEWSHDGLSAWVQDIEKANGSIHKGAGISSYKILGEELSKRGILFHPSEELYDDGYNLWRTLQREKRAGKNDIAGRYSYIPEDNFESFTRNKTHVPNNGFSSNSISSLAKTKSQEVLNEIAKIQKEVIPTHHSIDGIVNGKFSNIEDLTINEKGNVVLTRMANSESHLTKDWVKSDASDLINTSLSHGRR